MRAKIPLGLHSSIPVLAPGDAGPPPQNWGLPQCHTWSSVPGCSSQACLSHSSSLVSHSDLNQLHPSLPSSMKAEDSLAGSLDGLHYTHWCEILQDQWEDVFFLMLSGLLELPSGEWAKASSGKPGIGLRLQWWIEGRVCSQPWHSTGCRPCSRCVTGYNRAMLASGQRQMGHVCSSGVSTGCVCTCWQMSSAVKTWRCSDDSHLLVSFHIFSCLTFLVGWGCISWISLFWPMYFWKLFSMFLAKAASKYTLKNVAGLTFKAAFQVG